jgi:putative oxidoreductase
MASDKSHDTGKLILRLAVGGLVLLHGIAKLAPGGLTGIEGMLRSAGLPPALAYGAWLGEIAGPLLLIVGWQTRVGAALVAINMLFALWLAHAGDLLRMNEHGGWAIELQAMYLFAAIAVGLLGAGRFSADQS